MNTSSLTSLVRPGPNTEPLPLPLASLDGSQTPRACRAPRSARGIASLACVVVFAAASLSPRAICAQRVDSTRAGAGRPKAPPAKAPGPRSNAIQPPLSPRRAFITSALLPGYAQARLDRPTAGALFAVVEFGALAMMRKSALDLAEARRFVQDSVITSFKIDPTTGEVTPATQAVGRFTTELVGSRKQHYEDWLAVLIFNHLIAGADAFVAANLWDVPAEIGLDSSARGARLRVRVPW
jgi:hypothetical protein